VEKYDIDKMDGLITKYQYLFYCFSRLTGDGAAFYFRVTSALSLGTSFLFVGLFLLVDRFLSVRNIIEIDNLWMLGIWFGIYAVHIAYFQTGDRNEKTVEKFKDRKERLNPQVLAVLYITVTFLFFLSTFWIMGGIK
jgi:hypothetical protein